MKSRQPDPFSLLCACADCVAQAGGAEGVPAAAQAALRHQAALHNALQAMFITPMERGDLYLPACLCVRQLRLLAGLPQSEALSARFHACARAQQALFRALREFRQPQAVRSHSAALRRAAQSARARPLPGAETHALQTLFDSFWEMADLADYLLLKNN